MSTKGRRKLTLEDYNQTKRDYDRARSLLETFIAIYRQRNGDLQEKELSDEDAREIAQHFIKEWRSDKNRIRTLFISILENKLLNCPFYANKQFTRQAIKEIFDIEPDSNIVNRITEYAIDSLNRFEKKFNSLTLLDVAGENNKLFMFTLKGIICYEKDIVKKNKARLHGYPFLLEFIKEAYAEGKDYIEFLSAHKKHKGNKDIEFKNSIVKKLSDKTTDADIKKFSTFHYPDGMDTNIKKIERHLKAWFHNSIQESVKRMREAWPGNS